MVRAASATHRRDAFSPVDRHGCDNADVDRDGNQDILCAVGAQRGKSIRRHELSLAPDKRRRPASSAGALGISDPLGRGRLVAFIRLDDDAFPEVFISNAPDREDGLPSNNRFYRNVKGRFVPAPGVGLDRSHGTLCARVGDIDDDGDEDLAYCTAYDFAGRPAGLRLMVNRAGRLRGPHARRWASRPSATSTSPSPTSPATAGAIVIQLSAAPAAREPAHEVGLPPHLRGSPLGGGGRGRRRRRRRRPRGHLRRVAATTTGTSQDLLLLSRRGGRGLHLGPHPPDPEGPADDVIALDYDHNGRTDFVVLNGRQQAGPVQLLAAFPA